MFRRRYMNPMQRHRVCIARLILCATRGEFPVANWPTVVELREMQFTGANGP